MKLREWIAANDCLIHVLLRKTKDHCFGLAMRPANLHKAWSKMQDFLNSYFEPAKPEHIQLRSFWLRHQT